jgi:hypothetical protein
MSITFDWPGTLNAKVNAASGSTFTGAISGASSFAGTVVSATSSIGYATGAGGAVTQITSKATGVTLNKVCGAITTHGAALNAGALVTFAVSNTTCAAGDVVIACVKSGGTAGAYKVFAGEPSGTGFNLTIKNETAGNLSETLVINFVIIKAVAA